MLERQTEAEEIALKSDSKSAFWYIMLHMHTCVNYTQYESDHERPKLIATEPL